MKSHEKTPFLTKPNENLSLFETMYVANLKIFKYKKHSVCLLITYDALFFMQIWRLHIQNFAYKV